MSWTSRAAVGEGLRSALWGRWTSISVVLLAFAAFLGGVGLDLASYARTADQLKTWEEAGGRVLVVRSSTGGVDWQECSRLNEVSGVAGAVPVARAQSRFVPAHTPTSSRSLSVTSADIWRFLGRPAAAAEVLVSSRVDTVPGPFVQLTPIRDATVVGVGQSVTGVSVDVPTYPMRVATGVDLTWLGEVHGAGLLAVTAAPPTRGECFVRTERGAQTQLGRALPGLVGEGGSAASIVVDTLLAQGEFPRDLEEELMERPTETLALGGGLLLGLIGVLVQWIHRGSNALYRAIGLDEAKVILLRTTEWIILSMSGALLGAAVLTLTAAQAWTPWFGDLALLTGRSLVTFVLSSTSIWFLGFLISRGDLLTMLRDP